MSALRITIGVGLDRGARDALLPVIEATRRTRKIIESELNSAATSRLRTEKKVTDDVLRVKSTSNREEIRNEQKTAKALEKIREDLAKKVDTGGAAAAKSMVTAAEIRLKTIQGMTDKVTQSTANMAEGLSRIDRQTERLRSRAKNMREFMSGAGSNLRKSAAFGRETANNIAAGYGMDFSLSGMIQGSVQRQALSQKIASNASTGGKSYTGQQVQNFAGGVAKATSTSSADILGGIEQFSGLTGELDVMMQVTNSGKTAAEELSVLAKATGTSFEDMAKSAAELTNKLGDIPNKGQVAIDTLRALGGGGQVGAIELEHIAKAGGKLAAQSNKFTLSKETKGLLNAKGLTNETGQNMAVMGALSQMARQHGSRATPVTAMNSAFAFIRDFGGGPGLKNMGAFGLNAFTDGSKTKQKDPIENLLAIIGKTKGNQGDIAKIMRNQNSRDIVLAGADIYGKAKGAGKTEDQALAAVRAEFNRYLSVTMDGEEVQKKFNDATNTAASKAILFQENLNTSADAMANRLLPSLERLVPTIEASVNMFTKLVAWGAEHPGQLISSAIIGSIAKAAIGTSIKATLEKSIMDGGAFGKIGQAGAIAALTIATITVGTMMVDSFIDKKKSEVDASVKGGIADANRSAELNAKVNRGEQLTQAEMTEYQGMSQAASAKAQKAKAKGSNFGDYAIAALGSTSVGMVANLLAGNGPLGGIEGFAKNQKNNAFAAKDAEMDADRLAAGLARALSKGVLKVEVTNQPAPPVSGDGRTPPGK